jgi:hypothetical protein
MEETPDTTETESMQELLTSRSATNEGWTKAHEALTSYYLRFPFVYSVRPDHSHWIIRLSYAFAKYSYYGRPSDWPENQYVRVEAQCEAMHKWALWCWEEYMFKGVYYPLEQIIRHYESGLIPDCNELSDDYFC